MGLTSGKDIFPCCSNLFSPVCVLLPSFQLFFPTNLKLGLQVVLYLGLQNVRENFPPTTSREKIPGKDSFARPDCAWEQGSEGTRTRAWSTESHALPCEMNGSSVNSHLAGVGGTACTPREGEGCSQRTRIPFVFYKCVWHRNTPSADRGIIRVCHTRSPALPHCAKGASQVLARLYTHSPYHPSLPWLLQSHNFSPVLHYIPAKPIYPTQAQCFHHISGSNLSPGHRGMSINATPGKCMGRMQCASL